MPNDNEIEQLERQFWQTMVDKDAKGAATMIADQGLVAGPRGTMTIDPAKYEKMTEEGQWTLTSFDMKDVKVVHPAQDVAVIAYTVRQKGDMQGKPMDMKCADSSTWVRQGGEWKCALHTETVLEQT